MNVEERILTALRSEQPDRVPILVHFNPYVEDWYTHLPSYAEVILAAEQYADVLFNWDAPAPLMFTAAQRWIEQRDLGNGQTEHIIHTPDGPINEIARESWHGHEVIKRWIHSADDARRVLSMPYLPCKPDLERFFDAKVRLRGRGVAQATFCEPNVVFEWLDESLFASPDGPDRGLIRDLIQTAYDRIRDVLRMCLDAGVGPIYAFRSAQGGLIGHLSDEDFDEFVIEPTRRLIELVHEYDETYVILKNRGRLALILDRLATLRMDGLEVIEPPLAGDRSLTYVKDRIGKRVCLIANLGAEELNTRSTTEVERMVQQSLAAGAPGGGFILSPCPSTLDRDLPAQASANLVHCLKTAHELGKYPLRT